MKLIQYVMLGLLGGSLVACTTEYTLTESGSKVMIVDELPNADEQCTSLGTVEGKKDSFFAGNQPQSVLLRDATTDLLNNAAKLGANVVYHLHNNTSELLSTLAPIPISVSAEAYHCRYLKAE